MDKQKKKLEHIIKTLSRTKRKDYENYVINRVYNLLNDLDIKPETQKYVKRRSGWALIDLYFPQFNIGIEVDEAHHQQQVDSDKFRAEDIISKLVGYKEYRIDVTIGDINNIHNEIHKVVEEIKDAKQLQIENGKFKKWDIVTATEFVVNHDELKIDDEVEFETNKETLQLICGIQNPPIRRSYGKIKNLNYENKKWYYWFPILAVEEDGQQIAKNTYGWNNTVNSDWSEIYEYNEKGVVISTPLDKDERRIVFMKYKDPILGRQTRRFIGIYQPTNHIDGKTTYKRVSTQFNIIKSK